MDRIRIALYHGYELSGSGSNEYTRYLGRTLAQLGHEVVLVCGEPDPASHDFVSRAARYDAGGAPTELFSRDNGLPGPVSLHQLPRTSVHPVFLTDKQRAGVVKAFPQLTAAELAEYHAAQVATLLRVLRDERPDVLHANHLIYQPVVAAEACRATGTPFYVVPHGSSIEYVIARDERFRELASRGLRACSGVAWISREVRERVLRLYPDLAPELEPRSRAIGVGTDTALFAPLAPAERRGALDRLAATAVPGGRSPAQRAALRDALSRGDLEATRRDWDAYDHRLPDEDLAEQLARIPVEKDLLLFVGSMALGKGLQTLVAALPGLLARRPDTHLVLVGSGTYREVIEALVTALERGDLALFDALVARGRDLERDATRGPLEDLQAYAARPEARRLLAEHGPRLAGRVHLLGRLDHARLRHLFPCCRIAVFPSLVKEASPLVFAEALANGVLPTGAYHSGLRDGLDDLRPHLPEAVWGLMKFDVDPARRVQSLVDNLAGLLEALEHQDLSPRLRRLAEERYDWRSVAGSLVELAADLIRKPRGVAPGGA